MRLLEVRHPREVTFEEVEAAQEVASPAGPQKELWGVYF
jgi:hypothetical protein